MQLFRSEAHVQRWLANDVGGRRAAGRAGASIPIAKRGGLAEAWWWDRLDPAWRPHAREQNQTILDRLGLTGDFWRLG